MIYIYISYVYICKIHIPFSKKVYFKNYDYKNRMSGETVTVEIICQTLYVHIMWKFRSRALK